MSHLLDVNFLVACGWRSHVEHHAARRWLEAQRDFYTCPLAQLGFLRVSISPAFRATFEDARAALLDITRLKSARFLGDTLRATGLPTLQSGLEIADAYFVALAGAKRLRLATLDEALCRKPWAVGVAVNPLRSRRTAP